MTKPSRDGYRIPSPPSAAHMAAAHTLLAPWRAVTRPIFTGMDNLPERGPVLVVANHTLYGGLDVPMILDHVYRERAISLRVLGDHVHDLVPGWRDLLRSYAMVPGNPAVGRALMAAGAHVLVFPGGAREVNKRKGQKYQLLWGERVGFAKLAQQTRATIVPMASVGGDDVYDIVVDADTAVLKPLNDLLRRAFGRDDIFVPLGRGIGPTPIPKPQQFHISFGTPIAAGDYGTDQIADLRNDVRLALQAQIARLLSDRNTSTKGAQT